MTSQQWNSDTALEIPRTATCIALKTYCTDIGWDICAKSLSAAQSWARAANLEALARKDMSSVTEQDLQDLLKESMCEEHQKLVDWLVADMFV
jgi:hypothetical protein